MTAFKLLIGLWAAVAAAVFLAVAVAGGWLD